MTDKAKLEKLILLIGDLLQEKENAWMVDALLQTIENTAPLDKIAGNDVIQHIHEYCVEQKIDAQARAFYAKFPITQIREQLIEDYKKMEHERRRDDFNNFCLCMYQQIENIVSLFFHELIEPNWENLKERPAIKSQYNIQSKTYEFPLITDTSVQELVFESTLGTRNEGWFANRKFRAVLLFYYFDGALLRNAYTFSTICRIFDEIYQIRNLNHRGGKINKVQQSIIERIRGNEAKYYFKFYGFLQDFVGTIEETLQKNLRLSQ